MKSKSIYSRIKQSIFNSLTNSIFKDEYRASKIKGEIFYTITNTITGVTDVGSFENVVTLDASILIARLMKGNNSYIPNVSEPAFGVLALAVGTGDIGWDPNYPPVGVDTQRSLYNEICRKKVESTSYITTSGSISAVPTNIVDFNFEFTEGEAVGPLMEMGLVGNDIDVSMAVRNPILPSNGVYESTLNVVGKDILCNYKTFKMKYKDPDSILRFTWRLTF